MLFFRLGLVAIRLVAVALMMLILQQERRKTKSS